MANEPIKAVTLSDGRIAKLRRPRGKDLIVAQNAAPGDNKIKYTCALLAQIMTVDDHVVVLEDVQEMYASDIDMLATEAASRDFLSSSEPTSPPSSKRESRSLN